MHFGLSVLNNHRLNTNNSKRQLSTQEQIQNKAQGCSAMDLEPELANLIHSP